jgi:hypothetical protein
VMLPDVSLPPPHTRAKVGREVYHWLFLLFLHFTPPRHPRFVRWHGLWKLLKLSFLTASSKPISCRFIILFQSKALLSFTRTMLEIQKPPCTSTTEHVHVQQAQKPPVKKLPR